jgi:hypothetical protein
LIGTILIKKYSFKEFSKNKINNKYINNNEYFKNLNMLLYLK